VVVLAVVCNRVIDSLERNELQPVASALRNLIKVTPIELNVMPIMVSPP
jgi:hypothetical protein